MNPRKGYKFQKGVYAVIRTLFGGLICRLTQFSYEKYQPKSDTFLLLGNHTMDLDPLYACIVTKRHMRFVAAANIMRGFPGCFVKWLAGPIPRYKGAPADDVVQAVKENLAAGVSVAMYPEGNTSWDGETGFISKRTAELVKDGEGSLITFRTVGGYLRMPRWSKIKRKGKTFGRVVGEYSREELDCMSVDEIYALICRDLYVDAYQQQEVNHWKYRCKALAEGLEAVLYVCPKCLKIGALSSIGDKLSCSCGAKWQYTEEGFLVEEIQKECFEAAGEKNETASKGCELSALKNKDKKLDTILSWSRWQKEFLKENAVVLSRMTDKPICSNGIITVFGDRLEIEKDSLVGNEKINGKSDTSSRKVFYYKDITKMSVFRATRLFFSCGEEKYEVCIKPEQGRVGQIYFSLWRICTGKEYQ